MGAAAAQQSALLCRYSLSFTHTLFVGFTRTRQPTTTGLSDDDDKEAVAPPLASSEVASPVGTSRKRMERRSQSFSNTSQLLSAQLSSSASPSTSSSASSSSSSAAGKPHIVIGRRVCEPSPPLFHSARSQLTCSSPYENVNMIAFETETEDLSEEKEERVVGDDPTHSPQPNSSRQSRNSRETPSSPETDQGTQKTSLSPSGSLPTPKTDRLKESELLDLMKKTYIGFGASH